MLLAVQLGRKVRKITHLYQWCSSRLSFNAGLDIAAQFSAKTEIIDGYFHFQVLDIHLAGVDEG